MAVDPHIIVFGTMNLKEAAITLFLVFIVLYPKLILIRSLLLTQWDTQILVKMAGRVQHKYNGVIKITNYFALLFSTTLLFLRPIFGLLPVESFFGFSSRFSCEIKDI